MIFIRRIYCFAIGFFLVFSASAQPSQNIQQLKPSELLKYARNTYKSGDIYASLDYYSAYCKKKPDDKETAYILAGLYRSSRDYENAKQCYLDVYNSNNKKYILALFYYAQMLKMTGDYKKAKEQFGIFAKQYKASDQYKQLVKIETEGCDLALKLIEKPLKAEIVHLDTSVNKAHIESSPVFLDDNTLLYSSLIADSIEYFSSREKPVRQFYIAEKKDDQWIRKGTFEGPFLSENSDIENGVFSGDGNRFYFTRCKTNFQNKVICSLFLSRKENGSWTEPVRLNDPINSESYTTTQPAIGINTKKQQEVIYFVSDRPDGKGGMDIWYSIYDDKTKTFSKVENCGNKINTIGDEITPFYDISKRTLYFSSDGHPGMGGFDIFRSSGELSRWSQTMNNGFPLNTSVNDVYYTHNNKDKSRGFIVSNRLGGVALKNPTCCYDIYSFLLTDYNLLILEGCVYKIDKKVDVINKEYINQSLLDSAIVHLYIVDEETKETIYISSDTTNKKGKYHFDLEMEKQYMLEFTKDEYFSKKVEYKTEKITKDTVDLDPVGLYLIPKKPIVLQNIYYDYGKATLTENSKKILDSTLYKILTESPQIIVEIRSHTDSVSSDDFNLKLSQKRAESVVDYLIIKGIQKERMVPKGYGETQPVAANSKPDGSDNPDGRAMNRRTEFKVIGSTNLYSPLNREELIIKKEEEQKTQTPPAESKTPRKTSK